MGTTKPTPSHQVSQNKTQRGSRSSSETDTWSVPVGDGVCLEARPRKMTFKKQSAVLFSPIYLWREVCVSTNPRPGPLSHISSCVGATPAAEAPLGRRHHDADGELIRPHAARIRDVTCRHSCVFMKMKNHVVVAG